MIGSTFNVWPFVALFGIVGSVVVGWLCCRKKGDRIIFNQLYTPGTILTYALYTALATALFSLERAKDISSSSSAFVAILAIIGFFLLYELLLVVLFATTLLLKERYYKKKYGDELLKRTNLPNNNDESH